ncbi:protein kinase [Nocardioides immobilis]|uniref:Protein kinase n=1 Tax=Nocardioides immobilis TaxID=2049295 RepID=A0A417Y8F1_9ACTN|nr:LuxR C-terminal-related transcriptional regulator [Nocardioides immobilis]RHW29048.1 protein kinase [Nocardioides immobilis]
MTEAVSFSQAATDLPLEVTTFVGRRSDRTRIRELMAESRLVTLTGFGGIGKTRLALRMATELRRLFEGVHVVSLAGVTDPESVPDEFAATLGLQGRSRQSATIATVEYLRSRTVLLVLDNCEHVVDVAAVMADTLLRTCPGVRILATSREPLRIQGEVEFPVAPLVVPSVTTGTEPLQQYDAVQLFLDRARAIDRDFAVTEDNRAAVAAISRKLEGIPLAIELAAARLRAFTPSQLDAHLTDRWELLGKGSRAAPFRHQTMAACIEWSFDLCTPAERLLWAKASVFVDGFELDAAEAVCSDPDDREPVEEILASLVEKSVVTASGRDTAGNRYRMLPPIRSRGRAELVRIGRNTEVGRRHRDYYLGLLSQAHEDWFGPRQLDWIGRLRRDLGNLAKALTISATDPDGPDRGLRAGADLLEFGLVESRFQRGRSWLDQVLESGSGDPSVRARALRSACLWAVMQGDVDAAARLLEEGRALVTGLDPDAETLFVQAAGFVALFTGDPARAAQLLDEARRALAATGNERELAFCTALLALDYVLLGDLDGALEHHAVCLALTEPAGETWLRSWSIWCAGLALWARSDSTAAHELVTESLRLKRLLGEPLGIAVGLDTLAWFTADGDPERASVLLGAAQNEWDRIDTSQLLPGLGTPRSAATQTARSLLGEADFDLAVAHGRSLDQATAITVALDEEPTPTRPAGRTGTNRPPGSVLTRRERQIAKLVHEGLTNKEIAETLVISPRTVEAHVEHVLVKLGFTSRTQIAAWIGEQIRSADS